MKKCNCNRSKKSLENQKESKLAWCRNNPEKRAAQAAINNAVKHGCIDKPEACEECNRVVDKLNGHHKDYSKPFDAEWLCEICHSAKHKAIAP